MYENYIKFDDQYDRKVLAKAAKERFARYLAMKEYCSKLNSVEDIKRYLNDILRMYNENVKECYAKKDFLNLFLKKVQKDNLLLWGEALMSRIEKNEKQRVIPEVKQVIIEKEEIEIKPSKLEEKTTITEEQRKRVKNWVPVVEKAIQKLGGIEELIIYCQLAGVQTPKAWLAGIAPRHIIHQNKLLEAAGCDL